MSRRETLVEEAKKRQRDLTAVRTQAEASQVRGRWLPNDANVLSRKTNTNNAYRHSEFHARRAPRLKAEAQCSMLAEGTTGLDLDVGEVSDRVTQRDIVANVDEQTQRKMFNLTLDKLGPYDIDFSPNGTHIALAGLRGHFATFKWQSFELGGEAQLKDRCSAVKYLVDQSMIAVAQKRFVYMYTDAGVEMHCLSKMANMDRLAYLPKHMLLVAGSSQFSTLQYLDVSTGKDAGFKAPSIVRDPTACMAANPANGVLTTGDLRGLLKLWSPSTPDPLVQLKAHRGAVQHVAYHPGGRFLCSVGVDGKMKIWDVRSLRPLDEYSVAYKCDSIDVSQSGLVAVGGGTGVQVWRDLFTKAHPETPYLKHSVGYSNAIRTVKFCPFEDVLGVGHLNGISTLLVPGAGEANPDFFNANPYETDHHRKDRVVTRLLDKLAPETISLDLQIANVNEKRLETYMENLEASRKARSIRDKKARKAARKEDQPLGPTGLVSATGDLEDEVDEELGVTEKGVTKLWKTKRELQADRKKAKWDKKDSVDKVRSKQKMRHSRLVQKTKKTREYEERKEEEEKANKGKGGPTTNNDDDDPELAKLRKLMDDMDDDSDDEPMVKKQRVDKPSTRRKSSGERNAALARFV